MKTKLSFLALALGTFALGIAEFGMMGILSDVARELDIDVDQAGHLISAYSLGVAVGAPLLIFLRKMPLRMVLLLLASVIALGNLASALAPGYVTLLCARFLSGLPHGAFFGVGSIVCTRLAAQGRGAEAVATMVGGMTVANVVGVPAATFVANALAWRYAFGIVALFGLLAFIFIRLWVPGMEPLPDTGIKGQFRFLRTAAPWLIFGGVFFGQASVYCWLSYISPVMTRVAGFSLADMTWIMVLVGVGMVCGNILAGRVADRTGSPASVSASITALLIVVMPLIWYFADVRWLSLVLAFVASASLFGLGGPPQYMIVKFSKGGEMLGGAGIQIAFNVSNAMSAAIGGVAIDHGLGLASPALIGTPFALIGLICFWQLHRRYHAQGA